MPSLGNPRFLGTPSLGNPWSWEPTHGTPLLVSPSYDPLSWPQVLTSRLGESLGLATLHLKPSKKLDSNSISLPTCSPVNYCLLGARLSKLSSRSKIKVLKICISCQNHVKLPRPWVWWIQFLSYTFQIW